MRHLHPLGSESFQKLLLALGLRWPADGLGLLLHGHAPRAGGATSTSTTADDDNGTLALVA